MFEALENRFYKWIESEARQYDNPVQLAEGLAVHLVGVGCPIYRMSTLIPLLHPIVRAESILWVDGKETVLREIHQDPQAADSKFRNGPLHTVHQCANEVHLPISAVAAENKYEILNELRTEAATDYLATPMLFSDGSIKAMTFATKAKDGFSQEHIELLTTVAQRISPLFEIHTLKRTARTLMDTYVGPIAGERILKGEITNGHGEAINAVIWFSDLERFTELSNNLASDELVDVLNKCFGVLSSAVEQNGGQVLKFIGDAILAIFPLGTDPKRASESALSAANTAIQGIKALNAETRGENIKCGVAIHSGEVYFGNVGGEQRLDFTVIGPAVNLTSRIQSLTRTAGLSVLMSQEIARNLSAEPNLVGEYEFKGFESLYRVFTPT